MNKNDSYIIEDDYDPASRYQNLDQFEPEFWKKKRIEDLTPDEWELLCDGCGKCCLNKIEIKGKVHFTNTHCRFLNCHNCLCSIYPHRFAKVPDCRDIDLKAVREKPRWLPKTCAYWLLDNGQDLPAWHPLKSQDPHSVHHHHMSLVGREIVSETGIKDYEDYIIDWPDL